MNDYKELIEELKFFSALIPEQMCDDYGKDICEKAASAIETLLAERDAAIESMHGRCDDCISMTRNPEERLCDECCCCFGNRDCWQWRGIGGSDGT